MKIPMKCIELEIFIPVMFKKSMRTGFEKTETEFRIICLLFLFLWNFTKKSVFFIVVLGCTSPNIVFTQRVQRRLHLNIRKQKKYNKNL